MSRRCTIRLEIATLAFAHRGQRKKDSPIISAENARRALVKTSSSSSSSSWIDVIYLTWTLSLSRCVSSRLYSRNTFFSMRGSISSFSIDTGRISLGAPTFDSIASVFIFSRPRYRKIGFDVANTTRTALVPCCGEAGQLRYLD